VELATIAKECAFRGWDGFDADPIRAETVLAVSRFLESLPPGIPAPDVAAEPDGDITLEWHRSPWRTLSISVSRNNMLHYSALIGSSKHFGTEVLSDQVPKNLLNIIRHVQP